MLTLTFQSLLLLLLAFVVLLIFSWLYSQVFLHFRQTEVWRKPSSARRAWPNTDAKSQRTAKNQPKTVARPDVFSTTSQVMEEPKKTEINEFEIETHQVTFDSDFSDWDVDVLCVPDDDGPTGSWIE
jgi:hypothetical protein